MYDDADYDAEESAASLTSTSLTSSLDSFHDDGWIDEILHEVKSGKEATVYCCRGGAAVGGGLVAAKVYRPRTRRGFKNDAVYQEGRVIGNKRDRRAVERKSAHGREVGFASWIEHEFATLTLLHAAGANVPRPYTRSSSAILMDYVGDAYEPAPLLHGVTLERDEAYNVFRTVMRNIEVLLARDIVHGDLSSYNILWWRGRVTIIDVPQAVDPRANPNARALLARDIENVYRYVARYGVRADPARLADNLWRRFTHADL